ncbi:Guanine nucleotide-binding protein alpha-2 subunit [Tulasnella sp. 417]|nr:Guanine nucleotide-binding protein alpha-2 subunit [Tulasnella sp. 417]
MKQIKIVYTAGYVHDELVAFRLIVYENLVDSAKDLVLAIKAIGADCVEEINRTYAAQILEYKVGSDPSFRLAAGIADAIDSLWKDPIIATHVISSRKYGGSLR